MNIKKSLFISNILMIVIPVILSIGTALVMLLVFTGAIDIHSGPSIHDSDLFWKVAEDADELFSGWSKNPDIKVMKADIDRFNVKNNPRNISLTLYENNRMVYPLSAEAEAQNRPFFQMMRGDSETHSGCWDHYAFYSRQFGRYTAVVTCSQYTDIGTAYLNYKQDLIHFILLLLVLVILIIAITNYILTRNIIKRIVSPLEILNDGVQQIQLGNLDYRIQYEREDEFSVVCADFNSMAQRLRDSVDRQEKDETNRKELIAGISHDLRTPLTSIKAYVEGLLDGIASTPRVQRSYLETICAKAEDINKIVDKLFLFSKLDLNEFPFYPERLNIGNELITFVEINAEEYKSKGLLLRLTQNAKDAAIMADPIQLRNVLTNILENSVKYKGKECGCLEVSCAEEGNSVRVALADDGPGVPEEALGKIFDIFYRNDPSRGNPGKGSGLGLAISAKIIERSGGQIWAENASGGGLKIVIVLPKCK